tara:strand:+ start:610 stop:1560 length:951 start_codon:yes stop_codon:yes gene_type:complete
MTITVFLGDNDESVAKHAIDFDQSSFLVDTSNYKQFLNTIYTTDITVYTSFSDLPKINNDHAILFEILNKADCIFYKPPTVWSDDFGKFSWESNKRITEWFLYCINLEKNNVQGLDLSKYQNTKYLRLNSIRDTDLPVLWVSGCSISHGVGVGTSEKYGELLSSSLNLPVIYLTKGGSSLKWQSDQILRSDIQKDDILVWGLTQEVRTVKVVNGVLSTDQDPDVLLSELRLYDAVTEIHQVVNFCRKIQCRLILLPLISSEALNLLLVHLDEYMHLPYRTKPLDYGSDNLHPGPKTHQWYTKYALDKISKLNLYKE